MKGIALITGTSSGIGLHAAISLGRAGFTVVATMRDPGKAGSLKEAASAAGIEVDVRRLDVRDSASIETCVEEVVQRHGSVDILVNNAGSGFLGALEETTAEDLAAVMDVNFFGVWRVTQAVLPFMRAAQAGRIVTVTSVGGLIGQPFNDAYCAAKFAVEGFMESLAPVAQRLGIRVCLIEPGPVHTEFIAAVQKRRFEGSAGVAAYDKMREAYLAGVEQAYAAIGQSGADIAAVIADAACAENPHFRYATSDAIRGLLARKYVDPTGDSILALAGARLP